MPNDLSMIKSTQTNDSVYLHDLAQNKQTT